MCIVHNCLQFLVDVAAAINWMCQAHSFTIFDFCWAARTVMTPGAKKEIKKEFAQFSRGEDWNWFVENGKKPAGYVSATGATPQAAKTKKKSLKVKLLIPFS